MLEDGRIAIGGLVQMRLGRREIFALGELTLFIVAWMLSISAALDDYRGRANVAARNSVAASGHSQALSTLE
jgi:hypothetical protein